nr:hypothetical protein [Tanacetum cinerariifolium]
MDPNSSLGKICLGGNVIEILSDKVEGSGDWNSPEYKDTANSGGKKDTKAMVFHKMNTEEISDSWKLSLQKYVDMLQYRKKNGKNKAKFGQRLFINQSNFSKDGEVRRLCFLILILRLIY